MGARWRHFRTVCRHRQIVRRECAACGIFWRGLVHDLSKYSPVEFVASARYFQGDRSPIEMQKAAEGYSAAWQHHKGHNAHHWEYWTDFDENGQVVAYKMPYRVVVEMVCDWIGAGMVYSGEKWEQSAPLEYYDRVRAGRHFHPETEALILRFLNCIKYSGLETFHRMARGEGEFNHIAWDYDGTRLPERW